jgi:hypothetical protein
MALGGPTIDRLGDCDTVSLRASGVVGTRRDMRSYGNPRRLNGETRNRRLVGLNPA